MLSGEIKNTKFGVGDTVRVHSMVVEGNKQRVQVFEGIVISLNGRAEKTVTVRRIGAGGVGVERKWPLDARSVVKVDVVKPAKHIRRSKLYYLRELTGKRAVRV